MAFFLQRLGRFSFRRRRTVLSAWVAVFIACAATAALAGGSFSSNFTIPGTESQKANDLLAQQAPATGGATGRIVFAAPSGQQLTGTARATVQKTLADIGHEAGVASVSDPFAAKAVSKDGRTAYADIHFKKPATALTATERAPVASAAANAKTAGLQVGVTGDAAPLPASGGATEGIGIAVALLVLVLTFGSMLAAGLPLLTAAIGVGIGLTSVMALSAVTDLSSAVISLAAMLGLAVGIDYALFIITRYRTLARSGLSLQDAAARAVGTAGSAVVFAGATVIIALAALTVTGVPFLRAMGFAAAGTVAIAVLIATTLVPALLGFAGLRMLKGKNLDEPNAQDNTMGLRWVDLVVRHRLPAIGLVVAATLALALPVLHMRLGLPDDSSKAPGTTQRVASDLLTKGFGPGFNGQLAVIAELPNANAGKRAAATIASRLTRLGDVNSVARAQLLANGRLAIISVTPTSGPSSIATKNLVRDIRDHKPTLTQGTQAKLSVTGQTAINIDVADKMSSALLPYLAVVVSLAFILLAIAFRSLLVPLTAVGGFLLSIAAALGAMTAVFQDGFAAGLLGVGETAPIVSLTPILIIGILFGLAMDYQVFLVSSMREAHAHGANAQAAVRRGFQHSARVVTAAGLIMVSVFAGFILPDDPIIKSIGFALTAGILIDAFLIRMTLIPALMSLLGNRAWWLPRSVDRLIANVDLEGATLQHEHEPAPTTLTAA
jgi:RND superfamily putative drug exporter